MAPSPISQGRFRHLMARFATGVCVVTAHDHGEDGGMTVNAFLSVSLDPPSVLVALGTTADTTPLVESSGRFAVSILAHDQKELSDRFASRIPSREKFQGVKTHRGPQGALLLDGALAAFECEVASRSVFGTHALFVGRVTGMEPGRDVDPLIFYGSQYATSSRPRTVVLPEPRPETP